MCLRGKHPTRQTMRIKTLFTASTGFEAARHIDTLATQQSDNAANPASRLHGHSFLASLRCGLAPGWAQFPGGEVQQLQAELKSRVAPLDYRQLNELITHPTDENVARWLRSHLQAPGIEQLSVRSAPHQGVDLDAAGHAHVWRRYAFQSAHWLPNVAPGHKCGRMHGHGFEAILHADQDQAGGDRRVDHALLDAVWAPLHRELDHACLNDLAGLRNPTSELLSSWLWERIQPALPELSGITVFETASCGAHFNGERYRIWKELTLDSALQLKQAPDGDPLRRIHGHTYTLRLNLSAPLDTVMGWAVDFGDVKQLFNPIFQAIDHQPLHEIADLADCDTASIAAWILEKARVHLPSLDTVGLFETPGCGAIVSIDQEGSALPV